MPSGSQSAESRAREKELTITDRNRWIALYVLCVGMLMIVLDVTVVNVALPAIQDDLGFSQSNLAWVVNAYLIAFGGLLLLAGRFGDLIGRKRIFMVGLAVFTGASVLCGLAQTQEMLVGARFVQGIGGAMTSAVILGMIVTMFPEPREQAKAIGVYAFVASAGGSVGLLAGGVLTESINWHWIFFINIPIGIATALFAQRLLEQDKGIGLGEGADVPGAVLITSSLMLGVYTIVKPAADHGWALRPDNRTVGDLARAPDRLRRARGDRPATRSYRCGSSARATSRGPTSCSRCPSRGCSGCSSSGSLYLERVLDYSALEIGLAFLPVTIVMGTMSIRYAEPLIMRFGREDAPDPRPVADRRRAGAVHPRAGGRRLRGARAAGDDPARLRCRPVVPGADDARDVGRDQGGRGPGFRSRQHLGPGGRRAGARGARDRVGHPQRQPDRQRASRPPPR